MKVFFTILLIFYSLGTHAQTEVTATDQEVAAAMEPLSQQTPLSLKEALFHGLQNEHQEELRRFDAAILQTEENDLWEGFYLPRISLFMETTSSDLIDRLYKDTQAANHGETLGGSLGVSFGPYTVFNWGKDQLLYHSDREFIRRKITRLSEQRRELKLEIINRYFYLKLLEKKLLHQQQHLKQASYLYRLGRERAKSEKLGAADFLPSRSLYYESYQAYLAAKAAYHSEQELFIYFLGLKNTQGLKLVDDIAHFSFKPTPELYASITNAPHLLQTQSELVIAQNAHELALKNTLPLPKFSVELGSYAHPFSTSNHSGAYRTENGNRNLELVASIKAEIPLTGPGGLFNHREHHKAWLTKLRAETHVMNTKEQVLALAKSQGTKIQTLELALDALKMHLTHNQSNYDHHLKNYIQGKKSFTDLRIALSDLTLVQNKLAENTYSHLEAKLALAKVLGLEDLPGTPFEQQTLKGSGAP